MAELLLQLVGDLPRGRTTSAVEGHARGEAVEEPTYELVCNGDLAAGC